MESRKLEKKIRDWASDLSFKLPDGSAPPANYFALLTATPHRRRLWETLVELVQPRQKVEHMRKQIVVAKLRSRSQVSGRSESKLASDRIELWHKQSLLENQVKEKRKEIQKLERSILTKASDVIFEICKLSELKKLYEECSEKALALRLFTSREKNLIKALEKILLISVGGNGGSGGREVTLNAECLSSSDNADDSEFGGRLKELFESGKFEVLWEELLERKKSLLEKLEQFLKDLDSNEKNVLREKEAEIERHLDVSVMELKRKVTEKSLQVILNSMEGQMLDWQIEKLVETLLEGTFAKASVEAFSEAMSPLERSGCLVGSEKVVKSLRNYLRVIGLRDYEEYLREEAKKLEEEVGRSGLKEKEKEEDKDPELTLKQPDSIASIVEEINLEWSREKDIAAEIVSHHGNILRALQSLKEGGEVESQMRAVEDAEKLKCAPGKLGQLLLETPLDAFRTVQSNSGRLLFECESVSHCLNGYGGELKQFFSAMLILPSGDSGAVLSEVEQRTKMLAGIRNVIESREELARAQREIQRQLASIKLDKELCERNFEESDGVLGNVLSRSEALLRKTDLIERILRNWVEQPYRLMVKETDVERTF